MFNININIFSPFILQNLSLKKLMLGIEGMTEIISSFFYCHILKMRINWNMCSWHPHVFLRHNYPVILWEPWYRKCPYNKHACALRLCVYSCDRRPKYYQWAASMRTVSPFSYNVFTWSTFHPGNWKHQPEAETW